MPRKKSEDVVEEVKTLETETAKEEVVPAPKSSTKFEYEVTGNTPYDFEDGATVFDLKAQNPFRMNTGDVRRVAAGLKVKIPKGYLGLIISDNPDVKSQVCVFGAPYLIEPSAESKEIMVMLKMFGIGYKIFNMGDVIAKLVLVKDGSVKLLKK